MREFLKKIMLFFLPLLVFGLIFMICVENYLYNYPSTFQYKAKYLRTYQDSIEILILGSSHNQDAINPKYIHAMSAANLAFGGQSLFLDKLLLKKNLFENKIPKLRAVILENSYHSLEEKFNYHYHRNNLYLRFYDINGFGRPVSYKDYSIFLSNPKLYSRFLNPYTPKLQVNKYGFVESQTNMLVENLRFEGLKYNEEIIMNDLNNLFISRHQYENIEAFKVNAIIFEEMIAFCVEENIVPIILKPPVYKTYYKNFLVEKDFRRDSIISIFCNKYSTLKFLDFEQCKSLTVYDFKNEDHLNPKGAIKFSKILNDTLNSMFNE